MVKAIIDISEDANTTLNVIKYHYRLKDKSQAIEKLVELYEEFVPDFELNPKYVEQVLKRKDEKPIYIGTVEDFKRRYGLHPRSTSKTGQKAAKTAASAARRNRK